MDRHIFARCALALVLCWGWKISQARSAEPVSQPAIQYQRDLQAAHRESIRQNRPVLIVFGADWCHFCTKLEKESLEHPQIARYVNETFIPVHLDFDEAKRAAKILDVKAVPCVVALTPQAELVGRLDGFAPPKKVGEMLTKAKRLQTEIRKTRDQKAPMTNTMTTAR